MSDAGQPLKLADGTLVYKDGRIVKPGVSAQEQVAQQITVPSRDVEALVVQVRKKLSDLPDKPRVLNGIGAVLAYSLFGLDDAEIAEAIGCDTDRIASIRAHDAYTTMRTEVINNVLGAETGDIRELFVKHSRTAVETVVQGMQNGKGSDRIKAAADILDRAGFRPADVHEHRHRLEGGLTIEYVRKDERSPVIDIDVMEDC